MVLKIENNTEQDVALNVVSLYRSRLGVEEDRELPPTLETLQVLTELHLSVIPFENLSMHTVVEPSGFDSGDPKDAIVISRNDLIEKILIKKRGGCCLELNGLFSILLEELCFETYLVPCWVYAGKERGHSSSKSKFRTTQSHFFILVDLGYQKCVVDVGLGEPPLWPLVYSLGSVSETPDGMKSRIVWDPRGAWKDGSGTLRRCLILEWWKFETNEWEPRLQWDVQDAPLEAGLKPQRALALNSFEYIIRIITHPKSTFSRKMIVCLLSRDAKVSLCGRTLKVTKPRFGSPSVHKVEYNTMEELLDGMYKQFGIRLDKSTSSSGLDLSKSDSERSKVWEHL